MHKKPGPGKKTGARKSAREPPGALPAGAAVNIRRGAPPDSARRAGAPRSVEQLLSTRGTLRALLPPDRRDELLQWLRARLTGELAAHVVQVLPARPGAQLTQPVVVVDAPAWCTRLRYALAELGDAPDGDGTGGAPSAPRCWRVRVARVT